VVTGSAWRGAVRLAGVLRRGTTANAQIFNASVVVAALTVVTKVSAIGKEFVVANSFGTSDLMDAFVVAFAVPQFALNVVSSSLNAALLPTYLRVRQNSGGEEAQKLLSATAFCNFVILLIIATILAISFDQLLPILASAFSPAKALLTKQLFFLLLPTIILTGISTTWVAVLHSDRRFAIPALAPGITPVVVAVAVLAFKEEISIFALPAGTLIGAIAEAVVLVIGMEKLGVSPKVWWTGCSADLRIVLRQYASVVAAAVLMSSTTLVDQSMAASLPAGSVSALSYGNRVVTFFLGIAAFAIGTAVLPYFSRMVAERDFEAIRSTLRLYSRILWIGSIPLATIVIFAAVPLVRILFERGSFTPDDTMVVASVCQAFALQIPFYLLGILGVRLLSALAKGHVIMAICAVNVVVNYVGNRIFMQMFGVAGVALATSLVYALSCLLIYSALWRQLRSTTACKPM
jgi:putative peptidoglycan lipid II flippase